MMVTEATPWEFKSRFLPLDLQRRLVWEARRLIADERIHPLAREFIWQWTTDLENTHDRKAARHLIKKIRRKAEDEVLWHRYKLGEVRFHKCMPGRESSLWRYRLRHPERWVE